MKKSTKIALTTGTLGVVGALLLAGSSYADRGGFGPRFGMMGGHGGHGGHGPMVQEMLANVDTNGDGALTQDEINAAVDTRLADFDKDKNGALSLEEFQALWSDVTRPMAVRAFQFLDPDGDASITKSELADRFGSAVANFDRNDDGKLDQSDRPHFRGGHHFGGGPRMNGDGPRMDGSGPRWMDQDGDE